MAIDTDVLDRDFKNQIADLDQTATFKGVEYPTNRTSVLKELQSRRADFIESYEFTLIFRKAEFAEVTPSVTPPARDELITFEGVEYRIISTEDGPTGLELRTHMGAKFDGDFT